MDNFNFFLLEKTLSYTDIEIESGLIITALTVVLAFVFLRMYKKKTKLPKKASKTEFVGYSVWLEVPGLQDAIAFQAEKYQTHNHVGHCTILYGMEPTNMDRYEVMELFSKVVSHFLEVGFPTPTLQPTKFESGKSSLFPHSYIDLSFKRTPETDTLYNYCIETFNFNKNTEKFRDNPHGCLGYANSKIAKEYANVEQAILENFPDILQKPLNATRLALWSTQGTTADWERIDAYDFA